MIRALNLLYEKSPNYIKKTLDEIKVELLKDRKLQLSRQIYIHKLKEIFTDQVIDLNDNLQTKCLQLALTKL